MSLQDKMNVSAKPALKSLKTEVANELGLANYEQADKGNLTARQNWSKWPNSRCPENKLVIAGVSL